TASFLFQAEDGIRRLTVTGVQTCALPISNPVSLRMARATAVADAIVTRVTACGGSCGRSKIENQSPFPFGETHWRPSRPRPLVRSEERRVGKGSDDQQEPVH